MAVRRQPVHIDISLALRFSSSQVIPPVHPVRSIAYRIQHGRHRPVRSSEFRRKYVCCLAERAASFVGRRGGCWCRRLVQSDNKSDEQKRNDEQKTRDEVAKATERAEPE